MSTLWSAFVFLSRLSLVSSLTLVWFSLVSCVWSLSFFGVRLRAQMFSDALASVCFFSRCSKGLEPQHTPRNLSKRCPRPASLRGYTEWATNFLMSKLLCVCVCLCGVSSLSSGVCDVELETAFDASDLVSRVPSQVRPRIAVTGPHYPSSASCTAFFRASSSHRGTCTYHSFINDESYHTAHTCACVTLCF